MTFSGGAQAFQDALVQLPISVASRIGNITYIAPGTGLPLLFASPNGHTQVINGTGLENWAVTLFSSHSATAAADSATVECGHDLSCFLSNKAVSAQLNGNRGGACSMPQTFGRPNSGRSGGGSGYSDIDHFENFFEQLWWSLGGGGDSCNGTISQNGSIVGGGPCGSVY